MKTKELTIEEKAKAYDEVLERAKELLEVGLKDTRDKRVVLSFFPELAKSEDERIREKVIATIHLYYGEPLEDEAKEMIYWLEKQGEQKVVKWSHKDAKYLAELWEVLSVHRSTNPKVDSLMEWVKEMVSLIRQEWSEDDKEKIESVLGWLEKQGEQKPAVPKFRIGDKVKKDYLTYTVEDIDEDSYKLQAYSKDGNKGCTVFLTIGYEKDYELVEQKAEWSKEDERNFDIIYGIIYNSCNAEDASRLNAWLLSLRHQKQWKPSLAQLNALSIVSKGNAPDDIEAIVSLYNDLKKLKE